MSTNDLMERVRAAIEETMRIAREADPHVLNLEGRLWVTNVVEVRGWLWQTEQDHIAHHDPASILRRCEADLRTLNRHQPELIKTRSWCKHCERLWPCVEFLDRATAYGVPVQEAT